MPVALSGGGALKEDGNAGSGGEERKEKNKWEEKRESATEKEEEVRLEMLPFPVMPQGQPESFVPCSCRLRLVWSDLTLARG
jgi:hypothetical protein